MNKLSVSVFEKLIAKKATSREIDFVIYLAQYQNAYGEVEGVHYKDVCDALGVSIQGFYDLKNSLTEKSIIECVKRDYTDWDITVLDNAFPDEESYKKGYFQLHRQMFHSKTFQKMKAKAKLLAMEFMRFNLTNKCAHEIGTKRFFEKYKEIFGVDEAALRGYLSQLRKLFNINIKDGKYYFDIKSSMSEIAKGNKHTKNQNYNDQMYHTVIRRNRIKKVYENARNDIYHVLNIYHDELSHSMAGMGFTKVVKDSIRVLNESSKSRKKKSHLRPKLINKLLAEEYKTVVVTE